MSEQNSLAAARQRARLKAKDDLADQWICAKEFHHGGRTYTPGEPIPFRRIDSPHLLERKGLIVRYSKASKKLKRIAKKEFDGGRALDAARQHNGRNMRNNLALAKSGLLPVAKLSSNPDTDAVLEAVAAMEKETELECLYEYESGREQLPRDDVAPRSEVLAAIEARLEELENPPEDDTAEDTGDDKAKGDATGGEEESSSTEETVPSFDLSLLDKDAKDMAEALAGCDNVEYLSAMYDAEEAKGDESRGDVIELLGTLHNALLEDDSSNDESAGKGEDAGSEDAGKDETKDEGYDLSILGGNIDDLQEALVECDDADYVEALLEAEENEDEGGKNRTGAVGFLNELRERLLAE